MAKLLSRTDQISCFDEYGNEIHCRNTAQDGEWNRQHPHRYAERFIPDTETVTDRLTGLIWTLDANLPGIPLTWKEAFAFIDELNGSLYAGIDQWRLPTRGELFSLISHQQVNPSLPANHRFENVFHGYYWTQTACAGYSNQAWYIHFGGGRVFRGMQHGSYLVWPVTGLMRKISPETERFVAEGNTVLDRLLDKTWYIPQSLIPDPITWKTAFDWIALMNHRKVTGFTDWRLPNIRELESLVDTTRHLPAAMPENLTSGNLEGYWSSTTSVYEPAYAWVLYPKDGEIGVGFKQKADFYVLAIRE